jgi:hypothetical protein
MMYRTGVSNCGSYSKRKEDLERALDSLSILFRGGAEHTLCWSVDASSVSGMVWLCAHLPIEVTHREYYLSLRQPVEGNPIFIYLV